MNFFVMLQHYQKLFIFGHRSNSWPSIHFRSIVALKSEKKKVSFQRFKLFLGSVANYAEGNLANIDKQEMDSANW